MVETPPMPDPKAFRDHPLKRIGVSLLIAVAIHAAVLGAGAYYFSDYVFAWVDKPGSGNQLTSQKLEQALEETPLISPAFSMDGGLGHSIGETEIRSEGWDSSFSDISSEAGWSWEADPRLASALVVPADLRKKR